MLSIKTLRLLACVVCLSSCATSWLILDTQNTEQSFVTTNVAVHDMTSERRSDNVHRPAEKNTDVNLNKRIPKPYENSVLVWYSATDRNFCDPNVSIKVCTDSQGCGCALVHPSHNL